MYPQIQITVKFKGNRHISAAPIVDSGAAAAVILRNICRQNTILWVEDVLMLCLNTNNRLLGWYRPFIGGVDSSTCDVRVIALVAVHSSATRVILAHNHPSGSLKPSMQDLQSTQEVKAGLRTLRIELVDHIIMADGDHISLKDGGFI